MRRSNIHRPRDRRRSHLPARRSLRLAPRKHPNEPTPPFHLITNLTSGQKGVYCHGVQMAQKIWPTLTDVQRKWFPDWAKWFHTELIALANLAKTKELVAAAEAYRANPPRMAPLRVGTPFDHSRPSKAKPEPKPKTLQEMFGF